MLHPVAQLPQHIIRNVRRILRDEINTDALRADQTRDLLDLVDQHLGRAVKQQMRLVEKEDKLGLVGIADFGQHLEQL